MARRALSLCRTRSTKGDNMPGQPFYEELARSLKDLRAAVSFALEVLEAVPGSLLPGARGEAIARLRDALDDVRPVEVKREG